MPHRAPPLARIASPVDLLLTQDLCPPAGMRTLTLSHLGWQLREEDLGAGLRMFWVERGNCHFRIEGEPCLALEAGSAVILPRDRRLRVEPAAVRPMPWLMVVDVQTTPWLQQQLVIQGCRPVEVLRAGELPEALQMMRLVVQDQMLAEQTAEQERWLMPAAQALAARMLGALSSQPAVSPLAAMMADRRLGPALSIAMCTEGPLPDIDTLARRCHCSRATFTGRFHDLTGDSYLSYMTRWRMNLSVLRFLQQRATVAQEVSRYAYGSEAGYRKAFARVVGTPPGQVRRTASSRADIEQARPATRDLPTPVIQISQHVTPPDLSTLMASVIARL